MILFLNLNSWTANCDSISAWDSSRFHCWLRHHLTFQSLFGFPFIKFIQLDDVFLFDRANFRLHSLTRNASDLIQTRLRLKFHRLRRNIFFFGNSCHWHFRSWRKESSERRESDEAFFRFVIYLNMIDCLSSLIDFSIIEICLASQDFQDFP